MLLLLWRRGADKVSVNSAAVRRPELIDELSKAFGAQCIVAGHRSRKIDNQWTVHTHGGKQPTDKKLFQLGQGRSGARCRRNSLHEYGSRRNKEWFAIDPLSKLNELINHSCDCIRWRRKHGPFHRRIHTGKSRCCTGRKHFSLWRNQDSGVEIIPEV